MNFKLLFTFISIVVCFGFTSSYVEPKSESETLEIVMSILKSRHINPKTLDDTFSKKLFSTYIDSLDTNKIFLLQSDIDEFKKYETKLDDQIKENDLTFFFMTYDRIMLRMKEAKDIYSNVFKNKLDFTIKEETIFNESKLKTVYAKKNSELIIKWTNFLKTMSLMQSSTLFLRQNTKPYETILNEYTPNLPAFVESTNLNYNIITRADIFQKYINSILAQYDPHSKYLIPKNREKYLNKLTGKLTGIGVKLSFIDGFVQIITIREGGPAFRNKKFNEGDFILKIAEDKQAATNVAGYSTYDVTQLLKGKPNTLITITVKKFNGKIVEIPIKREIVSMNDYYVKSCLVTKGKSTYGIISFPKFYNDFDDEKAKNAADDLLLELEVLKKNNVRGIVLDIRDNGGGSVDNAIKIVGNFINKSPLLQLRGKDGNVMVMENENLKKNWDKDLVVLVNNETASAAEIIASTIKENNLGIIVGAKTFGKGTVQEFQDLNVYKPAKIGNKDMGALNISVQKFYQLNGKSVQKNGIIPDVEFVNSSLENREANIFTALNPDEVKPVNKVIQASTITNFEPIIKNSKSRILAELKIQRALKRDNLRQSINTNIGQIKTLNAEKYAQQLKDLQYEKIFEQDAELDETTTFKLSVSGEQEIKDKPYLKQKRNMWLDNLKTDYQIYESINILDDMKFLK